MGIAASRRLPPKDDGPCPCDAAAVAQRHRSFEFSESIDPGSAFRWAGYAYFVYKCSGGGMESARTVFRAALARCADYAQIYSAWAHLEMKAVAGGGPTKARELYEEWRARSQAQADGGGRGRGREGDVRAAQALLWTHYAMFEIEHGGADRARAVADAAVAACPRNTEVRAACVLAEVRLGDDARARAAFDRALADFADDEDATRQFMLEVRRKGAYLSEEWYGGCLHFCRGWWFRPPRWWEQI